MIQVPKEVIVEKINNQTGTPVEEIESRIEKKMKELSGLISEEGAAHIIANELGVQLFSAAPGQTTKIKEIYPGMKSVTTNGKITATYPVKTFERNGTQGKVHSFMIADETAQIRCSAWHEATEKTEPLQQGDIVTIQNAMARDNQGRPELSLNTYATVEQNPEGVTIEKVANTQNIQAEFQLIKDVTPGQTVELFGTIVQAYPPVFFVPKKEREEGKEYALEEKNNCVMNIVLDDGTQTIRAALFTDQALDITKKTVEELKNTDEWEPVKQDLLGRSIAVIASVQRNEQFDRTEIIIREIKEISEQDMQKIIEKIKKKNS